MASKRARGADDDSDEGHRGEAINLKKRKLMKGTLPVAAGALGDADAADIAPRASSRDEWRTWDAEGYGDAADRAYLLSLNMLAREQELAERQQYRNERQLFANMALAVSTDQHEAPSDDGSDDEDDVPARRRRPPPRVAAARALRDSVSSDNESSASGRAAPGRARGAAATRVAAAAATAAAAAAAAAADDDDDDDDDDESSDELDLAPETAASHAELRAKLAALAPEDPLRGPATLHEVLTVLLRRSIYERWVFEPFLDSLLPGTFVRISSGAGYRLARVSKVVRLSEPYVFGEFRTNIAVEYAGPRGAPMRTKLTFLSNAEATEAEFDAWANATTRAFLATDHGKRFAASFPNTDPRARALPCRLELQLKREALTRAAQAERSDAELEQTLRLRREAALDTRVSAVERIALVEDRDMARASGDTAEFARLDALLAELDAAAASTTVIDSTAKAQIAQTNRTIREANDLSMVLATTKRASASAPDPYARQDTVPQILWTVGPKAAVAPPPPKAVGLKPADLKREAARVPPRVRVAARHDFSVALAVDVSGPVPAGVTLRTDLVDKARAGK